MYSIDISFKRLDEQDRQIVKHIFEQEWKVKKALVLGSGKSRIALVLALAGFEVTCVDLCDYSSFYEKFNTLLELKKPILFFQKDLNNLSVADVGESFTLILAQRVLHYLRHENARELISLIENKLQKNGSLYVAVSCIDSDMGKGYEASGEPLASRFGVLSEEMQKRFRLTVPVCLYRLVEFKKFMKATRFKKIKLYQTAFGNIKGLYQI